MFPHEQLFRRVFKEILDCRCFESDRTAYCQWCESRAQGRHQHEDDPCPVHPEAAIHKEE